MRTQFIYYIMTSASDILASSESSSYNCTSCSSHESDNSSSSAPVSLLERLKSPTPSGKGGYSAILPKAKRSQVVVVGNMIQNL